MKYSNTAQKSSQSSDLVVKSILYTVLGITTLMVLYPILFTIGAAFTPTNSLAATSIVPFPQHPSLYQFTRLFTETRYLTWYRNTLKIATLNTLATLIVCVTSGYVFSRFRFGARKPLMASMIVLQMFPSFIGMVATYVILMRIGALNTHWGLILVYVSGSIPYNTWLMKGYFDTVSKNVEEAARVDGASQFTTYILIIVPIVKPMIMFLALTSFTAPWMDFIFPRLILRSDNMKTLAVGLFELINGRANDNYTMFAAGAILVAVPFAILFMAGQKFLLNSLAGDGVKE
jgi:arabinogalactan oligomer/maltooligosaccharide transport system permease protein